MKSKEFVIKESLRQGGMLTPMFFNVILDDVTKKFRGNIKKLKMGYRKLKPIYLMECQFVDDLMTMARNHELQRSLEIWNMVLQKRT